MGGYTWEANPNSKAVFQHRSHRRKDFLLEVECVYEARAARIERMGEPGEPLSKKCRG